MPAGIIATYAGSKGRLGTPKPHRRGGPRAAAVSARQVRRSKRPARTRQPHDALLLIAADRGRPRKRRRLLNNQAAILSAIIGRVARAAAEGQVLDVVREAQAIREDIPDDALPLEEIVGEMERLAVSAGAVILTGNRDI